MWKACATLGKLPDLPPSTWSFSHQEDDEVQKTRHKKLQISLRDLLRMQGATSQKAMREFLLLDCAGKEGQSTQEEKK